MSQERKQARDFPQEVLNLFDQYVHGVIDRRGFLDGARKFAVGGLTALGMFEALRPRYAWARQVEPTDRRIEAEYVEYPSPSGSGTMRGYLARPTGGGRHAAVLVIHENRGLNPYIEDVVRRLGAAGFLALGPDALTPLGGYPGNDDEGRDMQATLSRDTMVADFEAGARWLMSHPESTGRVGAVGFCFGGLVVNLLAVRIPELGAGVPFYGSPPEIADVPRIHAPLMIHYAEIDERVNAGWPPYKEALDAHGKSYEMYMYEGTNHGFHNDTTPRYDGAAARLAQDRTIAFFDRNLR